MQTTLFLGSTLFLLSSMQQIQPQNREISSYNSKKKRSQTEQKINNFVRTEAKNNLAWIDIETTGINRTKDTILEIACIVTDPELNILAEGPDIIIHHSNDVLQKMGAWCTEHHRKSGLTTAVKKSTITMEQAQQQALDFFKPYCSKESPVCGNSVRFDREFLQQHMSELDKFFHFRIIDVSSIALLVQSWYKNNPATRFKKKYDHRALDDIRESIAELKHYREHFFIPSEPNTTPFRSVTPELGFALNNSKRLKIAENTPYEAC